MATDYFRLAKLIRYEPDTGLFFWRVDNGSGAKAGAPAGTVHHLGYLVIGHQQAKHQAHRLAWVIMTGKLPDRLIDHANCDRIDNRWCNLREATHAQNMANARSVRDKILPKGVRFVRGRFVAQIQCNHKVYRLGAYSSAEEAHAAYANGAKKFFGEFARAA